MTQIDVDGPYFEDIQVGDRFESSPAVTVTEGMAAAHQAIVGNRLSVTVDHALSAAVAGAGQVLVSPALVWDISIGQSTPATHAVVANLFYRNLAFHRAPRLGDTLRSVTRIVGLRRNRPRAGRRPTGLALLTIHTVDQGDRTVLEYQRCAMIAARGSAEPAADPTWPDLPELASPTDHFDAWDLTEVRRRHGRSTIRAGDEFSVVGGDVVSSAPELARLTQNIAKVHHDASVTGLRLVYGGHCVGIALHQVARALPELVTVTSWNSCDHVGPVYEGDTLHSRFLVQDVARADDRAYARIQVLVRATRNGTQSEVLDWVFTCLLP